MPYKINGSDFIIQPTSGQWVMPDAIDFSGNGHPIYPSYASFRLEWQNLEPSGTYQLYQFFQSINITGSAVVDLPRFGNNSYAFYSYSGCVIQFPQMGRYFYSQTLDVQLLITKIRYDTV